MRISTLDLVVIGAFVALAWGIGLWTARRGSRETDAFFSAGRSLPWWLAGTSMIATAVSVDTPFGITGLVARYGISGMWFAWAFALGGTGILGAVLLAPLWRRSGVLTDAELCELRYDGRGAAMLRGMKAVYYGVVANSIGIGWVILAARKLATATLGVSADAALVVLLLLTLLYSMASGLWGVMVTDLVQYVVSIVGVAVACGFALHAVGGVDGLQVALAARYGVEETAARMSFLPATDSDTFMEFLAYIAVLWWVHKNIGGSPALVQRMAASRSAGEAAKATLWFSVGHFALNYWPMILAALASLALFPTHADPEAGYAELLLTVLPSGVRGLAIAALVAAFMSTIDTQLNLGATFLTRDLWQRFIDKRQPADAEVARRRERRTARIFTAVCLALGAIVATLQDSVEGAWKLLAGLSAGIGPVLLLRWIWWRVNAAAEIVAYVASPVLVVVTRLLLPGAPLSLTLPVVAGGSALAWLPALFWWGPTDTATLLHFFRKVRPPQAGWRQLLGDRVEAPGESGVLWLWLAGVAGTFSLCFGLGALTLGPRMPGAAGVAVGIGLLIPVFRRVGRSATA